MQAIMTLPSLCGRASVVLWALLLAVITHSCTLLSTDVLKPLGHRCLLPTLVLLNYSPYRYLLLSSTIMGSLQKEYLCAVCMEDCYELKASLGQSPLLSVFPNWMWTFLLFVEIGSHAAQASLRLAV